MKKLLMMGALVVVCNSHAVKLVHITDHMEYLSEEIKKLERAPKDLPPYASSGETIDELREEYEFCSFMLRDIKEDRDRENRRRKYWKSVGISTTREPEMQNNYNSNNQVSNSYEKHVKNISSNRRRRNKCIVM